MTLPPEILRRLDDARRELLDLSTRNRLLDTPRHSPRARTVEIVDELSQEVFRILVRDGKSMTFLAREASDKSDESNESDKSDGPHEIEATSDDDAPASEDLFADRAQPEEEAPAPAERHVDARLQTDLTSEAIQKRLLSIYYDARSFEEEQGANLLYLALGFLKWFEEPGATKARFAPLILIPLSLDRRDARARFRIAHTGEEIATNLSLQARVKGDFGIAIPDIADDEEFSPNAYFDAVAAAVRGVEGWEVLPNDIALGFFSFAKFLMYRDLDPAAMPEGLPEELIGALLGDAGFDVDAPIWGDEEEIDDRLDPSELIHVLDADGSQTMAIEEVKRGRNLVIQGPPGTGKSQTIANLIAAAVKEGRRVLFVAEKMAALEVVERRLRNLHLGEMCLELHSRKTNKREVLEALRRAMELGRPKVGRVERCANDLRRARDELNRHARMMHRPLEPTGLTPHQAIGQWTRLQSDGAAPVDFELTEAPTWSAEARDERAALTRDLAERVGAIGPPAEHPWRGVGIESILPMDMQRLAQRLPEAIEALDDLRAKADALAERVQVESPKSAAEIARAIEWAKCLAAAPPMDRASMADEAWATHRREIGELLRHGKAFAERRARLEGIVGEAGWSIDLTDARRRLAIHGRSLFRFFNGEHRRAMAELRGALIGAPPRSLDERLAIADALIEGREARAAIAAAGDLGKRAFGESWSGEGSNWEALDAIGAWEKRAAELNASAHLRRVIGEIDRPEELGAPARDAREAKETLESEWRALAEALRLDVAEAFGPAEFKAIDLAEIKRRWSAWRGRPDAIAAWIGYRDRRERARANGLAPIADRLDDGRLRHGDAATAFERACAEAFLRELTRRDAAFAGFEGPAHESVLAEFRRLDARRIELARQEVALAHYEGLPRGAADIGQIGVLRHEINKKRRHLPLRQLLKRAGKAIQSVKPVFMMSPLSVAQFLELGEVEFDLLLIDEASQVRPVDALGAALRARQMVVVGDDKQLPPTRFFDRVLGDDAMDDEEDVDPTRAGDLESILGLCNARGMPSRMLRWHYRSRHESLIAASNREFYDDKLYVIPSPTGGGGELGLRFHHVAEGRFDRGRSGTNRVEAGEVARAVAEHARRSPELSLGVGAFSSRQRDAILDELERLRRAGETDEKFFVANQAEPFFVKNLETIQGDERDVIFISVGYGPDARGAVSMNFGPLSSDGGERRLNVLISRARLRCEVFSSMTADDIDLSRATGRGPRALKTYLKYAQSGLMETNAAAGTPPAAFEAQVARALRDHGYEVKTNVGIAGCFIDVAVVDADRPDRLLLGVECDGPSYRSARSARDRDRLRPMVLEDRGWALHRVWCADWLRDPEAQLSRILRAIERARRGERAAVGSAALKAKPIERAQDAEDGEEAASASAPYIEADFEVALEGSLLEAPPEKLAEIVARIVEIEGPIHEDEVARRAAALGGAGRTSAKLSEAVVAALRAGVAGGKLAASAPFYRAASMDGVAPRDRSEVKSTSLRRVEMLPPEEIAAALERIVADHVGVSRDDAVVQAARLLGYRMTSAPLRATIEMQLDLLIAAEKVSEKDGALGARPDQGLMN